MTDYRLVMSQLLQGRSYREIEAIAGCSHRTISKAKKICDEQGLSTEDQIAALTAEAECVKQFESNGCQAAAVSSSTVASGSSPGRLM